MQGLEKTGVLWCIENIIQMDKKLVWNLNKTAGVALRWVKWYVKNYFVRVKIRWASIEFRKMNPFSREYDHWDTSFHFYVIHYV